MNSRFACVLALSFVLAISSGCGGGGGTEVSGDPIPPGPGPQGPSLTRILPTSGPTTGGTPVLIEGAGFLAGVTEVEFGGAAATDVSVLSDTELTCSSPAREPIGAVGVQVVTDEGAAVLPSGFTYTDPTLEPAFDLFSGTYFVSSLEHSASLALSRATWGSWTADGSGSYSSVWDENRDGLITTGLIGDGDPYETLLNGSFAAGMLSSPASHYRGGITSSGSVVVFAEAGLGQWPLLGCATRQAGTFSDSSLNGVFHCAGFILDGGVGTSFWGPMEYNGSGVVSVGSVVRNDAGVISAPVAVSGTYAVSGTGALTTSLDLTSSALQGGILDGGLDGGGLLHVSGGTSTGSSRVIMFAIPYPISNSMGNGLFSGEYWLAGMVEDLAGARTIACTGSATADGSGSVSISTTENAEGVVEVGVSGSDTYDVNANGSMTIGGGSRVGAISQDGRYIWIAGDTVGGSDPLVMVLVKK